MAKEPPKKARIEQQALTTVFGEASKVEYGDFSLTTSSAWKDVILTVNGERIQGLTNRQKQIMGLLIIARGELVTPETVKTRLFLETLTTETMRTQISHIKSTISAAGKRSYADCIIPADRWELTPQNHGSYKLLLIPRNPA